MEVRRTTEREWELLRSVRLAALQDAPYAFRRRYEEAVTYPPAQWRQQAGDETNDGKPAATFVGVRPDGTGAGMAVGVDVGGLTYVVAVWVAPEERGSGLFDDLMGAVAAWSPHDVLSLSVAKGNDRAIAAYGRLGYEVVGEEDGEWRMERHR